MTGIIIDTNVFIWWLFDEKRLSAKAKRALLGATPKYLSIVSLWEITIKQQLGKLALGMSLAKFLDEFVAHRDLEIIPIELGHLNVYNGLPLHHRDPFDRLIIAQATALEMPIVTSDREFKRYTKTLIW